MPPKKDDIINIYKPRGISFFYIFVPTAISLP